MSSPSKHPKSVERARNMAVKDKPTQPNKVKKGGAGKGGWGKPGVDDLDYEVDSLRQSEEPENVVFVEVESNDVQVIMIRDYFYSGDLEDITKSLIQYNSVETHERFVRKVITTSLDYSAYERELSSQLLSHLYGEVISANKIQIGFQDTLDGLVDLKLDIPNAENFIYKFIARAVADEILPPSFVTTASQASPEAGECLDLAAGFMESQHFAKRAAHIWGAGDLGSVKRLKEEVQLLLKEFLETEDVEEAAKCLRNLKTPSFHSRVVKDALCLGLEKSQKERTGILTLLVHLSTQGVISNESVKKGWNMTQSLLGDLKLDIPNVEALFTELEVLAKEKKLI